MKLTITHTETIDQTEPKSWRWWMSILSPEARRVLIFLLAHGGSSYEFDNAARCLSLSPARVLRALRELERYGFVTIKD